MKKKCKKCNKIFEPKKGLINYCSLRCRNSRTWSEEDKIKKSIANTGNPKVIIANKNLQTEEIINKIKTTRSKTEYNKIMLMDFGELSLSQIKKRIVFEQENKCNKCNLETWMGLPIILELEHKDGNHENNDRGNLECLCPNCHSQTDTWRGRNKTKTKTKITDEILLTTLINFGFNMRQALIHVGLTPKGGNYKRCHKLKREFEEIMMGNSISCSSGL